MSGKQREVVVDLTRQLVFNVLWSYVKKWNEDVVLNGRNCGLACSKWRRGAQWPWSDVSLAFAMRLSGQSRDSMVDSTSNT